MELLIGTLLILLIILIIINIKLKSKYKNTLNQLSKKSIESNKLEKLCNEYKDEIEPLRKYTGIANAEIEKEKILEESKAIKEQTKKDSNIKIYEATKEAKNIVEIARINSIREIDLANAEAKSIRKEVREKPQY